MRKKQHVWGILKNSSTNMKDLIHKNKNYRCLNWHQNGHMINEILETLFDYPIYTHEKVHLGCDVPWWFQRLTLSFGSKHKGKNYFWIKNSTEWSKTKATLQSEKELFSSGSTVWSLSTKSFGFPDCNLNIPSCGYIWDNQLISPKSINHFINYWRA